VDFRVSRVRLSPYPGYELRVTPAMEAGITDHVWSLEEIAALVPEPESKPRGPYKKASP
jgi:hypothetical protein